MKKFKFVSVLMILAVLLFGGITFANAAESLPDKVVSDKIREVEYIKNFPVIVKTTNNGKYYVYCMNMSATYNGNITFTKTGEVDPGYVYILNNRPQTSDKDRDFYITQMAVWYYEDYLTGKDFNLIREVKEYIVSNVSTDNVAKEIYNLYRGAKHYTEPVGKLELDKEKVSFTIENGYYVSSEIKVYQENLSGNIKYSLTNSPVGSQVVKSTNGVKVKIPEDKVEVGKTLTFDLNVESQYIKYTGYFYYYTSKYQKVLFQDPLETKKVLKDSITMSITKEDKKYEVKISKTDVTQSAEVPGATLVVKNEAGKEIATWVSTNEVHKITLDPGKYSLTETIAPEGYKLSSTTIEFMLDEKGSVYVKNEKGNYVSVDKVVMINELIPREFEVKISKTDVTQSAEVPGATLLVKDEEGNEIATWVSTEEVHKVILKAGKYSLTETLQPQGYKLSKTTIYFMIDEKGSVYVKNEKGNYVSVDKVVMINELIDVVSFAKKDTKTGDLLPGATLVIKDEAGNVVKEFTTTDAVYQLSLDAGKYTLSETSAPAGYLKSDEVLHFELLEDGTLKVMNNKGEYADSAIIEFYNTPETNVPVPATGKTNTLLIIGGIALLIGGVACAKKTIKEC